MKSNNINPKITATSDRCYAEWVTLCISVIALAFVFLAVACAGSANEQVGHPAVYVRIDTLTDCSVLQQEFNTAMDHAERFPPGSGSRSKSLSYAEYTIKRMDEIKC